MSLPRGVLPGLLDPDVPPSLGFFSRLRRELPGGRAARFVEALVVQVVVEDRPVGAILGHLRGE